MRRLVIYILYVVAVLLNITTPVIGSFVSKTPHRTHHFSIQNGVSCHQSHIDHATYAHHWDVIKNKQLTRPPVSGKVRVLSAIRMAFIFTFLTPGKYNERLQSRQFLPDNVSLLTGYKYLLHRAFLI